MAALQPSPLESLSLRLQPGDDLRAELEAIGRQSGAACVLSCVGSLHDAMLRFARRDTISRVSGPLEILSLSGTLCADGVHLHLAVADADGRCSGGHLAPGCIVRTTVELVIGSLPAVSFSRPVDPATGYPELLVRPAR